jgi:hypothetical protein
MKVVKNRGGGGGGGGGRRERKKIKIQASAPQSYNLLTKSLFKLVGLGPVSLLLKQIGDQ